MGNGFKEKLSSDLKNSLLNKDFEKAGVIRFLLSLLHNREIEKKGTGQAPILTDEEAIEILQKEVKKRKEAIELFKKGGRPELAEKETKELVFITEYLPPQMSKEEISTLVEELKKRGISDFNSMMKEITKTTKGHADGKLVSEIVREGLK
ncbi:MAG: GatB/YqeY domain-containing protein [Candidatus Liptonbacteria bacterium]|nr:GatB/YqeY domain-containing protein [Candidatus Liptonbacteria bacterium]